MLPPYPGNVSFYAFKKSTNFNLVDFYFPKVKIILNNKVSIRD